MKVLHIQKVAGIGGSERHLLLLLAGLAANGIDVHMCVLGEKDCERFVERLREEKIETTVLPAGLDVNPPLIGRLVRVIRGLRPDLVHTHLIHADLYGQVAALLCRIPAVSSLHATHSFYLRQPVRSAAWIAGRLARRTVAISEHVRDFATEATIARPERIRVVHYGIEARGWKSPLDERAALRSSYDLKPDHVAVGIASRLIPHKGHDFLLEAVAEASRNFKGLRLLVAGDGPCRGKLEEMARAMMPPETAQFCGFVANIRGFMNACDLLAFPTLPELGEGFGLAALEAMAAGLPVIATSVGSLPEVVVDGETGVLVPPGAVDQLASTLVSLARDPQRRHEMGMCGRERASSTFSLERMVNRTAEVYGEVVSGAATSRSSRPPKRPVR
ncbi:MAG: glycosyltransferase family 4 protein [Actinomycetota bacterium]